MFGKKWVCVFLKVVVWYFNFVVIDKELLWFNWKSKIFVIYVGDIGFCFWKFLVVVWKSWEFFVELGGYYFWFY